MALELITADDKDGYVSFTDDTDVFVKAGVVLGSQSYALQLISMDNDVTVQGAVVGVDYGIEMGPFSNGISTCTLSVAEGGLVAADAAARLYGTGNRVINNGDIMGQSEGIELSGNDGASTIENFGLISARGNAIFNSDIFTQAIALRNTGEIAGATAYQGGGGTDTIVNRGVMDGDILLGPGNDVYRGSQGALDGSVTGGGGSDRIICGADDDFMIGNGGSDTLKGGAGEDRFSFSAKLGASNVDTIRDFRAADDTIRLDNAVFTEIVGTGTLSKAQFAANTSGVATGANDRIIYETDTGRLFYDSNGSEAGGRTLFAVLEGTPAITAADFLVL